MICLYESCCAATRSRTWLFFVLAAPLGSGIEQHLLHLVQLRLQEGKVEVGALLGDSCKIWGGGGGQHNRTG